MKLYTERLIDLEHMLDLSKVGACTSCSVAEIRGTKYLANDAVAAHRALSKDARVAIAQLLKVFDRLDQEVEAAHEKVVALDIRKPMNKQIEKGDRIESVVDRTLYKKGDQGVCTQIGSIECEEYLSVRLDSGIGVGPVLADSWKLAGKQTLAQQPACENYSPIVTGEVK